MKAARVRLHPITCHLWCSVRWDLLGHPSTTHETQDGVGNVELVEGGLEGSAEILVSDLGVQSNEGSYEMMASVEEDGF